MAEEDEELTPLRKLLNDPETKAAFERKLADLGEIFDRLGPPPHNEFSEWYYTEDPQRIMRDAWCWIDPPESDYVAAKRAYVPSISGFHRPYYDFNSSPKIPDHTSDPLAFINRARRNGKSHDFACDCGDPSCSGGLIAT